MKKVLSLYTIICITVLSLVMANAQTGSNTKHYDKDGLAFDYPDDWQFTDDSTPSMLSLVPTRAGSLAQIAILMQGLSAGIPPERRGVTTTMDTGKSPKIETPDPCDFESARKRIADDLTKRVADQIHANATQSASVTARIGNVDVKGVQLKGMLNSKPVKGEVYTLRLDWQFVSLVYLFAVDDQRTESAWKTIVDTLTIRPRVGTVLGSSAEANPRVPISGGVLNGKAISLPRPHYPTIARSAHASGVVVVQVTIDESGQIMAAHVISGHPLLQSASLEAARRAKFSPTKLCGEPVRVTGVITYNFVAQ